MEAVINAKIYTMEEESVIENGYISFEDGKIVSLGDMQSFKDNGFKTIYDAKGAYLVPGFVDAHCHLGMIDDAIGFEGDDVNEDIDPVTPHLSAIDAINPADRCFKDAYMAGVTSVVTGPGSANVLGGSFAAIKTYGVCVDEMIIKNPVAIKAALGENPKWVYHGKNQTPVTRMATAALLKETLYKAKEYDKHIKEHEENPSENDMPDFDYKLFAMRDVVNKKIPLKVHTHRADDIFTAIRIAREFDINITLDHCSEGYMVAEHLKKAGYPIMVGPIISDRCKPELKNLNPNGAKILSSKGIDVAVTTDHPETPIQYLPLSASVAFSGEDFKAVLASITINAAKNTGIDEFVGSLKIGKDADFSVFESCPLELNSRPEMVFINGERVV